MVEFDWIFVKIVVSMSFCSYFGCLRVVLLFVFIMQQSHNTANNQKKKQNKTKSSTLSLFLYAIIAHAEDMEEFNDNVHCVDICSGKVDTFICEPEENKGKKKRKTKSKNLWENIQ